MAKVYSAVSGLTVMIHGYGLASADQPVTVPEEVARDVEKDKRLRVVRDSALKPRLGAKPRAKEKE